MSGHAAGPHVGFDRLVEYWLGETDDAGTRAIDEHLLGCEACGGRLDQVVVLARGVRGAFAAGLVQGFVGPAFVAELARLGVRVREHVVPCNGGVECSVEPGDELVVGRLQAPLAGVDRLDVVARVEPGGAERRLLDVPFDAPSGEVVLVPRLAELRGRGAHDLRLRLLAVDARGGEREIGRYTFHHRPRA